MARPSRIDHLELDLDVRMHSLWADLQDFDLDPEIVGPFIRAAYGTGYMHALAEAERGELCKTHGYAVPLPGSLRRAA